MRILFSDEMIDLNEMYNSQNYILWVVNRTEADDKGSIKQIEKFTAKVTIWLGVCSKSVTPWRRNFRLERYIKKVLPVVKKYGD